MSTACSAPPCTRRFATASPSRPSLATRTGPRTGVFQIALAYVLVTRALTTIPALEASLILLIEPVLNPVWAWIFHGERPGFWALAGGGVILGATTIRAVLDARRAPESADRRLEAGTPRVPVG